MAARDIRSDRFMQVHREVALGVLARCGVDEPNATRIAEQLLGELMRELGGSKVYIGVGRAAHRRARVLALAGDGLRAAYIAARLGISKPTVYRILRSSAAGRK